MATELSRKVNYRKHRHQTVVGKTYTTHCVAHTRAPTPSECIRPQHINTTNTIKEFGRKLQKTRTGQEIPSNDNILGSGEPKIVPNLVQLRNASYHTEITIHGLNGTLTDATGQCSRLNYSGSLRNDK